MLIYEPHPEVRTFLARLVGQLGYEPILAAGEVPTDGDVLLVDAASPDGVALARALRGVGPNLPLVCSGSGLPGPELLALEPVAFLLKPYTVAECEQALGQAAALVSLRRR